MYLSLFFIIIKGIVDAGGFGNVYKRNLNGGRLDIFDFNPDPFIRQSFWSLLLGQFVGNLASYSLDQQMMQRFQTAKSKKTAQVALLLNIPFQFVLTTLCCSVGLILYANFYECDPLSNPFGKIKNPNQLVGYFVINNLNNMQGVAGLFLGALFCASLSSLSSAINSQSMVIYQDFFKSIKYFQTLSDAKSLTLNKLIVLVCGSICTGLSFLVSQIEGNLIQIGSSLNGAFFVPLTSLFVLGMISPRTNKIGALSGSIIGIMASCWISFGALIVKPVYPKLGVSIQSCNSSIASTSTINMLTRNVDDFDLGFKKFYYMSYMLYTAFGFLISCFIGFIVSFVTSFLGYENKPVDKSLILFDIFGFIPYLKNKIRSRKMN